MKKRFFYLFFIVLSIGVVLAAISSWHIEKLDNILRLEIEKYAAESLPVNIHIGSTSIQLLPVSLEIKNIQIDPKKELQQKIKSITIESLTLQPNLFHLLWGKFTIKKLFINNSNITAFMASEKKENPTIDLNKILDAIPIQQLELLKINLDLTIKEHGDTYKINTNNLQAKFINDRSSIMSKLKIDQLDFGFNGQKLVDQAQFETQFFLTNKNLVLSDLKFQEKNSFILSSGSTQHDIKNKTIRSSNINIRLQAPFKKVQSILSSFLKPEEIHQLEKVNGQIRLDTLITSTGINQFKAQTDLNLINFSFEDFHIGEIQAEGSFNSLQNHINIEKTKMISPGIRAQISNFKMNLNELTFDDAKVDIQHFELHDYLKYAINEDIPAYGNVVGQFQCAGNFKSFLIKCPGQINGNTFKVNTKNDKSIISVKEIAAEGTAIIDGNQVSYHANLKTPLSKGQSSGTIHYKNGFLINYDSSSLDLGEIGKLSSLEVSGTANIKGSTQGNSKSAVFDMLIDTKNSTLDGYKLGDLSAKLNYKSEQLFFNKIQGSLASSRYLGNLVIDLNKDWLNGKIQIPFVDLAIAQDSIKKQLDIPFPITGTGSAVVSIDGPLDAKKLSFKLKSRVYNAVFDAQHADTVDIDLSSNLGQIDIKQLIAEEKKSKVVFTGKLDLTEKLYGIDFRSEKIYLDDVSYSERFSSSSKGVFSIGGKIRGPFVKPELELRFNSDLFQISGQKLSPIEGLFVANKQKLTLDVKGPEKLAFKYRDFANQNEVQIEGHIEKVNLAPFLTNMLKLDTIDDYQIYTSSTFNLKIGKEEKKSINGYIFIPEIRMIFQKNEMKNEEEITFFLSNNKINFSPFVVSGESGSLNIKSENSSFPLGVQISGALALSYLQIFAPFLETLEGRTSLNLKIQSDFKKFQLLGSAFIDDAFIKLPQVPHAIENLDVDILFNQDQLIINSMKGRFASGYIYGDGKILIKGTKDIPTFLNIHLDSVDLSIPAQFRTKGNARLQLTGQWLPLTLSGSYDVYDGLITKEITSGSSTSSNPHDVFLPPELRDNLSSPILLDLTITPMVPLKIKNTMLDGKIEGQVKVAGDPQSPILSGNIAFNRGSLIKLQDVVFKTVDSSFSFKGQAPPNPEIYLLAETRYKNYDIEMLVQGTASKPKFKLSSQPSLTEPEIISLLTLGTTTQEQEAKAQAAANSNTTQNRPSSVEFRSDLFSKIPLSKEFKERFGVDVKFSPTFDSETNVAAPKISVGYQISDKVTATGSAQGGTDRRAEGSVRYDLNRNVGAKVSVQTQSYDESSTVRVLKSTEIIGVGLDFRKEFK